MSRRRTGAPSSVTPLAGDVLRRLGERLGEADPDGVVRGLRGVVRRGRPAEGEDLDARQLGLDAADVLALAAGDVRDRAQHDDGGDRQFDREAGQAEEPAHPATAGRRRAVQPFRWGAAVRRAHGRDRGDDGLADGDGGRPGHDRAGPGREQLRRGLDRHADEVDEARREGGALERPDRAFQAPEVYRIHRHPCGPTRPVRAAAPRSWTTHPICGHATTFGMRRRCRRGGHETAGAARRPHTDASIGRYRNRADSGRDRRAGEGARPTG